MIELLIYFVTGLIVAGFPVIYYLRYRRKQRIARETLQKSILAGRDEPVSLHPVIDPDKCIGSGACVSACPEGDILGLINNRGVLIKPSNCIGHGECQSACPVGAISLVFGTEMRGVDIPFVKGNFETNVPGLFVAGELGGMGLIRNAVIQGRQAAENVRKSLPKPDDEGIYDLVIIGAGPAGISAALQAKKDGLNFIIVDQSDLGGTILSYPRNKMTVTRPVELPGFGKLKVREISKEKLLDIFRQITEENGIGVLSGRKVEDIGKENGIFRITTQNETFESASVILAIGRRGSPRKLNVPGENCGKVLYNLLEPEHFKDSRVLIVGGGDSAVEAAVALSEQPGITVHISYRKNTFSRIKDENTRRIEALMEEMKIIPLFNTEVSEIREHEVLLTRNREELILENDYLFVLIGGELPAGFLQKIGVETSRKYGEK